MTGQAWKLTVATVVAACTQGLRFGGPERRYLLSAGAYSISSDFIRVWESLPG